MALKARTMSHIQSVGHQAREPGDQTGVEERDSKPNSHVISHRRAQRFIWKASR